MWKKIRPLFFGVIIFSSVVVLLLWHGQRANNEHFKKFNESDIKGILTESRGSSMGVGITIGYVYKYVFSPNDNWKYKMTADIGDSVIKPAFAHELIIKKKDSVYYFRFREYAEEK
jgi:hypothetical protein